MLRIQIQDYSLLHHVQSSFGLERKSGRSVNLTTDRHVVPRLRICVVILFSSTCLHGMVWCTRKNLYPDASVESYHYTNLYSTICNLLYVPTMKLLLSNKLTAVFDSTQTESRSQIKRNTNKNRWSLYSFWGCQSCQFHKNHQFFRDHLSPSSGQ